MTGFKNVKVTADDDNKVIIEIEKPAISNNQSKFFILYFLYVKKTLFFSIIIH